MSNKPVRILSIDGGGIRGILPGQILTNLEELTGKRVWEMFDMVAGTSTGGILACALLCPEDATSNSPKPKFTAQEATDLYLERGDDIFDVSIFKRIFSVGGIADEKYNADELEETLEQYLGDVWLSSLLRPCLMRSLPPPTPRPPLCGTRVCARCGSGCACATGSFSVWLRPARRGRCIRSPARGKT